VLTGLIASAFAQRAEIEAVNAKWVDFFNRGDFAGVASLYTEDTIAFPPGASMMKGRAAIEAMWKGAAEQVSYPKFITLEVKPLGPSAAQEIGHSFARSPLIVPRSLSSLWLPCWRTLLNACLHSQSFRPLIHSSPTAGSANILPTLLDTGLIFLGSLRHCGHECTY
jgi:hypothetical protein